MTHLSYRILRISLIVCLCPGLAIPSLGQPIRPRASDPARATADPAWDAVFTRDCGWNGGDIGHCIDLGGRTLWLFGDSFIGPVREGARAAGNTMLRSAIAWHDTPAEPGAVPGGIAFGVPRERRGAADDEGSAAAAPWLVPEPGLFADDAWYWMMGDGAMVTRDGERRRILFATVIGPSGNPEGMWNFRRIGGVVFTIENPGDPADRWRAEQRASPIVGPEARFGEPPAPDSPRDNWGLAIVRWPADSDTVYIYGVRSLDGGQRRLLLARAADATLDAPGRWEFFDGEGWVREPTGAAGIASWIPDEFTIQPMDREGRTHLVMIHSEMILGRRILARSAGAPEGPWSEPTPVFKVLGPEADSRLITYAAKGHGRLSRPGELLVSYVINSTEFAQVLRDASLYRPRFVRVPKELLPAPPP